MRRGLIRTAVAVFWLITMAWLLRYEAFPYYFTRRIPGYRALLSDDVLVMDSWMKLLFNDAPVGYSHSSMDIDEDDLVHRYNLQNDIALRLHIMGEQHLIQADVTARLDAMHELQEFKFNMSAGDYMLNIKALHDKDQLFRVSVATPGYTDHRTIMIPRDTIIYSPMTEIALRDLKPGQTLSIKTLDPASLSAMNITITAERKETIIVEGKEYETTVLSSDYYGATVHSWIAPDGSALRQETPFGWTMEKCTREEALAALDAAGKASDDILSAMAVPCSGRISEPRHASALTLQLTGVPFSEHELRSHRQDVISINGDSTRIRTRADMPPTRNHELHAPPPDLNGFLQPTPAIQSDHREIIAAAEKIVRGKQDDIDKSMAIFRWVADHVDDVMTVSVPSAIDVLHTMKGDCNEHTYLFVAICRAAGIPAKVNVGLAYHEGGFYYHAWPAAYVGGRWIEMDPTWNQEAVDATHIRLVEGEIDQQFRLVKVMGRLKIEVLGEE